MDDDGIITAIMYGAAATCAVCSVATHFMPVETNEQVRNQALVGTACAVAGIVGIAASVYLVLEN